MVNSTAPVDGSRRTVWYSVFRKRSLGAMGAETAKACVSRESEVGNEMHSFLRLARRDALAASASLVPYDGLSSAPDSTSAQLLRHTGLSTAKPGLKT